jgi:hypothetical protein
MICDGGCEPYLRAGETSTTYERTIAGIEKTMQARHRLDG